ncbi:MAG TPA: hypothetical protein VLK25_10340 [Allosphingosinicella sp.]|nr:hypothetical protein [Allosphingosinicella sp.]
MIFSALPIALALLAAQPSDPPEEDSTYSERQPVRLAPLPAARALAAFHDICMAGFPDPAAIERAAAASDLGFVRSARADREAPEWSSRHGLILFRPAQTRERERGQNRRDAGGERRPRLRWLARCDFWIAIDERLEPDTLIAAIGTQLAPGVRPVEEILGYSWQLPSSNPEATLKLIYLPSTDDDPRLFTLSLQLLPANRRP